MANLMSIFTFICIACSLYLVANAADPDPLQDTCVATSCPCEINGKPCKPKEEECPDDFKSDVLKHPGDVNNKLGFNVTAANVVTFPGVNTQGVSFARLDFCPGGINPFHVHPRGSEILFCAQGTLYVGFIDTMNRLFATTICAGELFIFPRGLIHFQLNVGHENALAFSGFNSQNPGTSQVAKAIFDCTPPILEEVIEKSFQMQDVSKAKEVISSTYVAKVYD